MSRADGASFRKVLIEGTSHRSFENPVSTIDSDERDSQLASFSGGFIRNLQ